MMPDHRPDRADAGSVGLAAVESEAVLQIRGSAYPEFFPFVVFALRHRYSRGGVINVRRSCRHDWILLLVQGGQGLRIQLQMRLHQFRRRQRQPLIERDIGVVAALEYLKEA